MADLQDLLKRLNSALADRYRLERVIGSGGHADVFLAQDLKHHHRVAIKVLRPEVSELLGPERFLGEIERTLKLQHPFILHIYDSGTADGLLYYVMQYVEEESLRERLNREKQLPVEDVIKIASEVADALDFAHNHNVVHRDLKPDNILLPAGHAIIADFGIARAIDRAGGKKLTETGFLLCTPAYASPEQASGSKALDGRSDLYSLGCVVYEMLAGQPPYTGPTAESILPQHMHAPIPDVGSIRQSTPPGISEAIKRSLAKAPADRFSTGKSFAAALAPSASTEPAAPVPNTQATTQRVRHRGVTRRFALTAIGIFAIAASAWFVGSWWPPETAPGSPMLVAVLPFEVHGAENIAYLREGMVDLLTMSLDGAAGLRGADPRSCLSFARRQGSRTPDPALGRNVAEHLGAGLFVLGDIHDLGGSLRVNATLYQVTSEESALGNVSVEGTDRQLTQLVDHLAIELIAAYAGKKPELGGSFAAMAAKTTDSPIALKAYLEGEQALRGRRYDDARAAFERAVHEDSTFAVAWHRLGLAASWPADDLVQRNAAAHAERHMHRLPERERLRVQAWSAALNGGYRAALALYHRLTRAYPDDADAWYSLGEVQYHWNALMGRSPLEARDALERALDLDPGYTHGMAHLLEIAAMEGRAQEFDSLLTSYLVSAEHGDSLVYLTLRAHLAGDRDQQATMLKALENDPAAYYAFRAATALQDLDAAELIARRMIKDAATPFLRGDRHWRLGAVLLGQGRWRKTVEALREAGRGDSVRAVWQGALWTATTAFPVKPAEIAGMRARLRALRRPVPGDSLHFGESYYGFPPAQMYEPAIRAYLEGLLSLRLNDFDSGQRATAILDTMKLVGEGGDMTLDFAYTLRALEAYQRGKVLEASRIISQTPLKVWFGGAHSFRWRVYHRFLRAELLRSVGRHEEAIGWYSGLIAGHSEHETPYVARAYLGSAESLVSLGRNEEAVHHYSRFIDLWKDCDPELQPSLDDANARRDALRAAQG